MLTQRLYRCSKWKILSPFGVGAIGLAAKYGVESVVGVQYPRVLKRMMEMGMDEPPAKVAKVEEAASSKGGGGAGGGEFTFIHRPPSQFKRGKLIFTHHRFVFTKGYQFAHLNTNVIPNDNDKNTKIGLVTTPYAHVPCNVLSWYMTPAEFKELPQTSKAVKFATSVTPVGYRLPFLTNSAQLINANTDQFMMAAFAMGLCNKYQGVNCKYTSTSADPMIPTEANIRNAHSSQLWYGTQATGTTIDYDDIPTSFGNILPLESYYTQHYDNKVGEDTLPEIMKDLHIFTFANNTTYPPMLYEYRPQICVLKNLPAYPSFRLAKEASRIHYGVKHAGISELKYQQAVNGNTKIKEMKINQGAYVKIPYESYIEQCGSVSHGIYEYGGGVAPPSLHVGILPNATFITDMEQNKVQPSIAIWKVDTAVEIEYSFDLLYPERPYGPPGTQCLGDPGYIKATANNFIALGYKAHCDSANLTTENIKLTS